MEKTYYGDETIKAMKNFGRSRLPSVLVLAYAEVKKAVLTAIQEKEERFPEITFKAIIASIDRVLSGEMDDQFVLPLKQGGAGTSVNMNLNEVIANLSNEMIGDGKIDPIDDINRGQSTNDTFPTAVTIVLYRQLEGTEKKVIALQETLIKKETEYGGVLMAGRTEMQAALPITLGQVFASWAGSFERDRWRLNKLKERIRTIALGGTAVGTGFNSDRDIVFLSEQNLRRISGLPLTRSQNLTDEVANQDKLSELAGGLKLCAENLFKMTGDLLLYTSSMIGEIKHPSLQYGSTIMAAKNNPVLLEFARGLSIDVIHEAGKISEYCRNGQLQLNPYLPFILDSFLTSFDSLDKALSAMNDAFFPKMEIDRVRIEKNLLDSNILLNLLLPFMDYHEIKTLYEASARNKPGNMEELKAFVLSRSKLTKEQVDHCFDPLNATSYRKSLR
jgi:aspartate ammonia-lyase